MAPGPLRLDEQQQIAVDIDAAPLRIIAGPGSGKTRVLTQRIVRRIEAEELDPRRVLALTFTRRAAGEIRSRLHRAGIRDIGAVGTFHAVALAQLRQHRLDHGGRPPNVLSSKRPLLEELAGNERHLLGKVPISLATNEIDWATSQALTPDEYASGEGRRRVGIETAEHIASLLAKYHGAKRRRGVFDFDDLLLECTHLLTNDSSFREAQQWLFRHVFVDEFQDLNRTQFRLLQAWVGDRSDLCVVGDPDQAIYGWNGADSSYLTSFEATWPSATTVSLLSNHRSAPGIVAAADAVLGRPPTDVTSAAPFTSPTVARYDTEEAEAIGIARHIRWARLPGQRWGDWAVLARTNGQLARLSSAMAHIDVPFRIRGRGAMLRQPEVAALVDQLVEAGDDIASVARDLAEEHLAEESGVDKGIQSFPSSQPATAHLIRIALEYVAEDSNPNGASFRSWLRTIRPGDLDPDTDSVDLVTFHAAKGLEWPHVVIAGVEEGYIPIRDHDPEEQRLFYVAVSRAEQTLHLTWASSRERGGKLIERTPSRWLELIQAVAVEPSPPPIDRVLSLIDQTRRSTAPGLSLHDGEVLARLTEWRDNAARARGVTPAALLRDRDLVALAEQMPRSLQDLANVTGHSEHRLARMADTVLGVIWDRTSRGSGS
jgi:DNA helicase II / ATP-dependent DNA helicase PcrA